MPDCIYTIGHSNHSLEKFIELLRMHDVTAVADVRSSPYSRYNPQFNRESLQSELLKAGIAYLFLGRELGARSDDESCNVDGTVQYDRLAQTDLFQRGLARLADESRTQRIAMMCAEKDPLTCHRGILVCRHLAAKGMASQHILDNGQIETHDEAIARLLAEHHLDGFDLFRSHNEMIADAYDQRGKKIAYTEKHPSPEAPHT